MKLKEALNIAQTIREYLLPLCDRAEIAGSIRRRKSEVKDIKIVCQPKVVVKQGDLFGEHLQSYPLLDKLATDFPARFSAKKILGRERYFKFELSFGINLDLFVILPPAQWGVGYVIRTGPAEFSHWCVTNSPIGGLLGGYKISGLCVYKLNSDRSEVPLEMPEEIDFLKFLGLEWVKPEDRKPKWTSR